MAKLSEGDIKNINVFGPGKTTKGKSSTEIVWAFDKTAGKIEDYNTHVDLIKEDKENENNILLNSRMASIQIQINNDLVASDKDKSEQNSPVLKS